MQDRRFVSIAGVDVTAATPAVAAGGFVFTSAVTAAGADGTVVPGGIGPQTRRVLERLGTVLDAAGSSRAQAVTVNVYLRRPADFAAMNEIYREVFADRAPTRTTIAADLGPDVLVAMSAVAVPNGAARETLHPAGWVKSPRPYSYIVRAGGLVFLSGLVSRRGADDQSVPGATAVQVRTILDNARVLLDTAGLTLADVVSSRVFITDAAEFAAMNDVYREYFPASPPARATAVTGLMGPDAKVEITLVATTGEREVIGANPASTLPLSPAVRTGPLLFLSGVLGNTDANATDVAAQTRETMARIGRTLGAAGLTFADVVDNLIYVPDLGQAAGVHTVYGEIMASQPPARTTVGAGLVARTGLVEMMMIAVRR